MNDISESVDGCIEIMQTQQGQSAIIELLIGFRMLINRNNSGALMIDVNDAISKLGNALNFIRHIKENDLKGREDRALAVSTIITACIATRNLSRALKNGDERTVDGHDSASVSELWLNASQLVGRFDEDLQGEFALKAYGWGTGVWDDPAFPMVPRKVEEILAEAIELMNAFKPILTEDVIH